MQGLRVGCLFRILFLLKPNITSDIINSEEFCDFCFILRDISSKLNIQSKDEPLSLPAVRKSLSGSAAAVWLSVPCLTKSRPDSDLA